MNVVLIGYRGTGKSSVARILAQRLRRKVISTDAEVVRRANCTIPDIVESHGWKHFRSLESEVCREVAKKDDLVVDTGGGAILRPDNVANLKANGKLFWLTADVKTIASRIGTDTTRPSLTGTKTFIEEIEQVLQERLPKYRSAADVCIPTDDRTLDEVAEAILAKL